MGGDIPDALLGRSSNDSSTASKQNASSAGMYFFLGVTLVLLMAHVAAMLYFSPSRIVLADEPIVGFSFNLRAEQTAEVVTSLEEYGQWWSYDPKILAGSPSGVLVDTNSRAWQLWVWTLESSGVPRWIAFNSFVWIAHLLVPLSLFFAAMLFGIGRWSSLLAAFMGACAWYFDGFVHWCWYEGMVDYALAAVVVVPVIALLSRIREGGGLWFVGPLLATVFLATFIHAYVAWTIAIPIVWLIYRAARDGQRRHIAIFSLAAFAALISVSYWLHLSLRFSDLFEGTTGFGEGTLSHVFFDFVGVNADRNVSGGIGQRTGFRWLILASAGGGLWFWREKARERVGLIAIAMGCFVGLAYIGGYFPGVSQLQPYRFLVSAIFLGTIPAAYLVQVLVRERAFVGLPKLTYVFFIVLVIGAVPKLVRDVAYFIPAFAPFPTDIPDEKPHIADMIGFGSIGYPRHREFRHSGPNEDYRSILDSLGAWNESKGRIMVESWPLAEYIAAHRKVHVLCASPHRTFAHRASDIFDRYKDQKDEPSAEVLAQHLERYGVGWVIPVFNSTPGIPGYRERLSNHEGVLQDVQSALAQYRLKKSKRPIGFFEKGTGSVRAVTNRIMVSDTISNEDVVLRFHWLDTLVCKEGCDIERADVPDDAIGFIRVRAPHPVDFIIENGY